MRNVARVGALSVMVVLISGAQRWDAPDRRSLPVTRSDSQIGAVYGRLPISFEPNQGQTDSQVKFIARGAGYGLFLTSSAATLALHPRAANPAAQSSTDNAVLKMEFAGSNPAPTIRGDGLLGGTTNYFIGNDPARWHTAIPTYSSVDYAGLDPGIDLTFHGTQGNLEYDVRVAPGADPTAFRLTFGGAHDMYVDGVGNLVIRLGDASLTQNKPVAWQMVGGERRPVQADFAVSATGSVSFRVPNYDRTRELIIDPTLAYSTYLGGTDFEDGLAIAVDASGSAYVTGVTGSTDFSTQGPFQAANAGGGDAFVAKINAAGSAFSYSTYLGGGGFDEGTGIAVDSAGNAYVTGLTLSTNFPTQSPIQAANAGGFSDAFVAKLDATGSALSYSTYLGGTDTDFGHAIDVDTFGAAYVTGETLSTNFPTLSPIQAAKAGLSDAFVAKINPAGSALTYSTYLGGTGLDFGLAIAVDTPGSAYVTGYLTSPDFPTQSAFQVAYAGGTADAFVTKIDPTGSTLVYSTYLGASDTDQGRGIAVDSSGAAYVTGFTISTTFPTQSPIQPANAGGATDAFVTKFNPAGSALTYSTYLGGSGEDRGFAIAVDSVGSAYLTGETNSTNFPTQSPIQAANGGAFPGALDAFVTNINPAGSALIYSTYLGGSFGDIGEGIALDTTGSAYVIGQTGSSDFPTRHAIQPTSTDPNGDAFIAKIGPGPGEPATVVLNPPDATNLVGTSHTVTATVTDASTEPTAGIAVRFTVTGSVTTSGSCVTNMSGQCSFTYNGPTLPGADLISAYADTDGDNAHDSGEPVAVPATKAWAPPTSTAGQSSGGGQFMNHAGSDKIAFGFSARYGGNLVGECSVVDPSTHTHVNCTDATSFTVTGTHATVFGHATVNGVATTYRLDVDDLGNPGKGVDNFSITTGSGYSVGGVLTAGNILVR